MVGGQLHISNRWRGTLFGFLYIKGVIETDPIDKGGDMQFAQEKKKKKKKQ
jgi:hypothetical protein